MSEVKKFKSALDSPVTLEVEGNINSQGVFLAVDNSTILLAPSDAPALCLAILEAVGVTRQGEDFLAGALESLQFHIEEQERATAEARERVELEAEALELFNVVREHDGEPRVATWDGFHAGTMEVYLLLARRARELAKEATK
ncbi:hypothetical protein [Glutamicibacter soli]|uniref:hypothetical protein n=1 Tax=Glutamicibacter soli TaxID=453836 RepID=UPI003FD58904